MDLDFGVGDPRRANLWVALGSFAMVVLVFVGDWITPDFVEVGSAYQAPVVFAALRGTRLLTLQVIVLGLAGLAIGWFMDFAADSFHFSARRIESRLFSVVSLLIVGALSLMLRRNADRVDSPQEGVRVSRDS
jgi:hypothetical protein